MRTGLFDEWQDICQNKHQGNEQSTQAFQTKVAPTLRQRQIEVLQAIKNAGNQGLTCKELAEAWGIGMNAISGRFSELKKLGEIEPAGSSRDGSRPYKNTRLLKTS
jgi:predicted transcriptional regulator